VEHVVEVQEERKGDERRDPDERAEELVHAAHEDAPDRSGQVFEGDEEHRPDRQTDEEEIPDDIVERRTDRVENVAGGDERASGEENDDPGGRERARERRPSGGRLMDGRAHRRSPSCAFCERWSART